MLDYHSIFSSENNTYQKWQSILLAYNHKQVQQPGSLVCLLSGQDDPGFLGGYEGLVFPCKLATYNAVNKDSFAGYNRNSAFCEYLTRTPIGNRVIIMLDPDMVFTRPWEPTLYPNEEIAEAMWYMSPDKDPGKTVIKRYARRNHDKVQAFGFPLVMRESALREVIDRLCILTEILRGDPWVRKSVNWITDMYALTIACAELGIRMRCESNCNFTGDSEADRPLIHYTYGVQTPLGYRFDKRNYTPWSPLPPLKPDVPAAERKFHEIFDRFLREEKHDARL